MYPNTKTQRNIVLTGCTVRQCAAQVLLGARPRRGAQPVPGIGVGHRVERGGERTGLGAVIEHARLALAPVPAKNRPQAGQRRRHHREAGRHVFENLQRRPVESERQRRVRRRIERRDPYVGGRQRGGHGLMRHRSGEDDVADAGCLGAHPRQLRSLTDHDRTDLTTVSVQHLDAADEIDRTVPAAKRAGEHRNRLRARPHERRRTSGAGMKAIGVGAPLHQPNPIAWCARRQNGCARRDDEIRDTDEPFAPALHRLASGGRDPRSPSASPDGPRPARSPLARRSRRPTARWSAPRRRSCGTAP